jgi:UDP-glucose 4-epimerase
VRHVVTGGAGFIGSHLVDALLARGDEVVVIDDLSSGSVANLQRAHTRLEFVRGTVLDAKLVTRCIDGADGCFHLAASVGVRQIVGEPLRTLLNNTRGTDVVLAAAAAAGCRVVFASSSEVYGRNDALPLREDADRVLGESSRWSYASAKSCGEAAAFAYAAAGADMTCARLFNTVGPRQSAAYGMVLPRFVRQALAGDPLTVYGDGRQRRCFTHVGDTVDALLRIMDVPATRGRAFNVGASDAITVLELAERVIAATRTRLEIDFVPFEAVYGSAFEEPPGRCPDTTRIRRVTGWAPRRTLDDAIHDVVAASLPSVPA